MLVTFFPLSGIDENDPKTWPKDQAPMSDADKAAAVGFESAGTAIGGPFVGAVAAWYVNGGGVWLGGQVIGLLDAIGVPMAQGAYNWSDVTDPTEELANATLLTLMESGEPAYKALLARKGLSVKGVVPPELAWTSVRDRIREGLSYPAKGLTFPQYVDKLAVQKFGFDDHSVVGFRGGARPAPNFEIHIGTRAEYFQTHGPKAYGDVRPKTPQSLWNPRASLWVGLKGVSMLGGEAPLVAKLIVGAYDEFRLEPYKKALKLALENAEIAIDAQRRAAAMQREEATKKAAEEAARKEAADAYLAAQRLRLSTAVATNERAKQIQLLKIGVGAALAAGIVFALVRR